MSPSRPILGACALAAALLLPLPAMAQQTPPPAPTRPAPAVKASPIEGRWTPAGGNEVIDVRRLSDRVLELKSSDGWIGVGILDDRRVYRGVFEFLDRGDHATGLHLIDWGYGVPEVTVTWTSVRSGEARQQWHRADGTGSRPAPDGPAFGEYVYVEQLPEAVTKVPPQYPQAARDARVEGTVIVQALVGRDGRVKDTRVVHSIPGLDEAAVAAVRQWVFKPALTKNEPVAVWVAVPIKFTLH